MIGGRTVKQQAYGRVQQAYGRGPATVDPDCGERQMLRLGLLAIPAPRQMAPPVELVLGLERLGGGEARQSSVNLFIFLMPCQRQIFRGM